MAEGSGSSGSLNINYLKTPFGILKILEFIFCLIAFSLCAAYQNDLAISVWNIRSRTSSRIGFFIFVTVTAWIFVCIVIILNVLRLMQKIKFQWKMLILALLHGIAVIFLLIASSLIADDARKLNEATGVCRFIEVYTATTCATYTASVVFGFVCLILFAIDAVLHLQGHKKSNGSSDNATA